MNCTDVVDSTNEFTMPMKKCTLLCGTFHLRRLFFKNFDVADDVKSFNFTQPNHINCNQEPFSSEKKILGQPEIGLL